jgi:hypothetical protein
MPLIADFTAADAAGTPVTHTFKAITVEGGVAMWNEQTATHPSGWWTVRTWHGKPSGNATMYRPRIKFDMPKLVTETINGVSVPKKLFTNSVDVSFSLSPESTVQDRKDLRKLLVGMIDTALIKGTIEDFLPVYG